MHTYTCTHTSTHTHTHAYIHTHAHKLCRLRNAHPSAAGGKREIANTSRVLFDGIEQELSKDLKVRPVHHPSEGVFVQRQVREQQRLRRHTVPCDVPTTSHNSSSSSNSSNSNGISSNGSRNNSKVNNRRELRGCECALWRKQCPLPRRNTSSRNTNVKTSCSMFHIMMIFGPRCLLAA